MSRKLAIAISIVVPLSFGFGRWTAEHKPARYDNRELGFRITGPEFSAIGTQDNGPVVLMYGPTAGGFAPNLNILVQPPQSAAEFRKTTLEQFKQAKLELRNDDHVKVGGRDAWIFEYAGPLQGRELAFMALAVFDQEHTYLATCTATPDQFTKLKSALRESLDSFTFIDATGAKAKS